MIKKIFIIAAVLLMVLSFSACEIKNGNKTQNNPEYSFTQKETVVFNYFKDKIPDFNFDNEPVERYRDGISYTFSVTCSQNEFKKYVKKLKNNGFEQNTVEAETYFSADTDDGFFVEATYVGDMLTVFVKKT